MESNGRRISSGGRASRGGQPRTPDQFLEEDAKTFASFLVGRRVEVTEKIRGEDDLRVKGIVRRPENSENKNPHEKIRATNWQVSIMDTDRHREYTYCVLDFIYPDGRPYQNKKRVVLGEFGIEEVTKDIELKILDSDEDQVNSKEEAALLYKERHFLGGCAHGQDTISRGVAHLKGMKVSVWWPGERAWYDGRVSGTISKARQIDIDYDDGEQWKNKGWRGMVWRLDTTPDTLENGKVALEKRNESNARDEEGKKGAGKAGEGGKRRKSAPVAKAGTSQKRKTAGTEYDPAKEIPVMDLGHVVLNQTPDNMLRLVDKSLPRMKKKSKQCKAETPGKECAIFTIDEGGQKRKHTLCVVATTFNVGAANMSLDQEQWRLDWSLEPKQ